jgi:hypothetical protein
MGLMYKEIVFRRKLPVMITFFFIMTIMLYLLKISEIMNLIPIYMSREIDLLCLFILILFGAYEIQKCQIQYKYSIIADQLIIHKVKGKNQELVEDINIQDIKYIGYINKLNDIKINCKKKKYICSLINMNKYCCIYSNGHRFNKIYFEPSSELIEKLKYLKNKQIMYR